MKYPKNVWQQLKSITADELIRALEKDDWVRDIGIGSELVYRHDDARIVSIHYHPRKTYHRGLLKGLLDDIGWTEEHLRRLKLIK
jgi:predicted RNA binding protein YcfA (HicA-like mRNA interferase family)